MDQHDDNRPTERDLRAAYAASAEEIDAAAARVEAVAPYTAAAWRQIAAMFRAGAERE